MKAVSGRFTLYLIAAAGFLSFQAGCYKPQKDIDSFRPEAEKYFATLEKVGKTVAALSLVREDTMSFPNPNQLRFASGPDGNQNAELVIIDELSNFGSYDPVSSVISSNGYHLPAWALLHGKEDPHVGKVTKDVVPWRFHQLLDIKYLLVVRTKKQYAEVTGDKEFKGGEAHGDVILCEVNDAATLHGGIAYAVKSSDEISFTVHGDAAQQNIDRKVAVMKDLDEQAEKLIHQKLKAALPGVVAPYW